MPGELCGQVLEATAVAVRLRLVAKAAQHLESGREAVGDEPSVKVGASHSDLGPVLLSVPLDVINAQALRRAAAGAGAPVVIKYCVSLGRVLAPGRSPRCFRI